MDKSWMETNRISKSYVDGVAAFTDYAVHNLQKTGNIDPRVNKKHIYIPCPCTKCLNHIEHKVEEVQYHLYRHGIDISYTKWTKHGEEDEPSISAPKPVNATTEFVNDMDFAYIPTDGPTTVEMVNATKDNFDVDDLVKFQELLLDAEKPLYEGCPDFTKLSTIVKLLNLKGKYGASDKFFTELLGLTKKVYENIPAKVMWYFPIIPRLQRLFKIESILEDLRWHATRRITDGVLRHPADSQAWRTIDEKFPEIAEDTRNLWLGISANGVDVNTGNRHHSVWPVLTVIYNLPPWLCMKRKFINLSVLISGYPGNDIDIFLEPLVDDLHTLFETGVDTYDASTKDNFNLRAVVLWTINDYPALGTLCGCPYSGFKGCVVCGKDTNCVRLSASSKQSYVGHRRYLPYNHPFRKQKKAFNGQQEFLQAPIPMTGEQIYNEVKHIENKWGKGKRTNNNASENQEDTRGRGGKIQKQKRNTTEEEGSSSQVNGQNGVYWKKFNIWYRKLKYWRHNPVPHCIDFMHVEKNVAESIVGTLLHVPGKTKDGLNARLDLAELGVKPELFAMQDEDKTTLPPAGYTLTNAEKDIFCETLHNIKVPEGYCSNFSSLVNLKDRKLIGLKSHDYHMLMQEFLPIAIRLIMHPPIRYAIIRFCFFFKSICSKKNIFQELDKMQAELVVTLCLLEKFFPPLFFDIMIHLTVHLTMEVKLCGPICFRWMYPFERCMKVINGHVRNRNKPDGCIAKETIAEEIIEFFSEYHKSMETIGIPPDKHETYENEEGKPLSAGKSGEVSAGLFQKAHFYVIQNTDEIVSYIERHKQVLKTENSGKRIAFLENEHSKYFAKWLREEVERELAIDKESVSETVSGVSVEAIDLHISKEVATTRQAYYYGVLQEIWVLDYHFRQIPHFKCDWVNNKSGGVKRDKIGYTLVDLNNLGHKVDPFVLGSQALQVFYVKNPVDKKLSIVFRIPLKNYKDTYDEVDEEFSTVIHHRNDNVLPLIDQCDLANESRDDYYRKDYGDEYKDNGRFWGSKLGCNESDVKPSWKDIEKAKACMLAKAQASEASSKAKVEACGSKAKLQASTKTLIVKALCKYVPVCKKNKPNVYSHVQVTGSVLGLPNFTTWDEIEKKMGARKSKTCTYKAKGKRKVSCGS
ncbi:putative transposase-associated domain-containing protein [Tanacetum coccineum]